MRIPRYYLISIHVSPSGTETALVELEYIRRYSGMSRIRQQWVSYTKATSLWLAAEKRFRRCV